MKKKVLSLLLTATIVATSIAIPNVTANAEMNRPYEVETEYYYDASYYMSQYDSENLGTWNEDTGKYEGGTSWKWSEVQSKSTAPTVTNLNTNETFTGMWDYSYNKQKWTTENTKLRVTGGTLPHLRSEDSQAKLMYQAYCEADGETFSASNWEEVPANCIVTINGDYNGLTVVFAVVDDCEYHNFSKVTTLALWQEPNDHHITADSDGVNITASGSALSGIKRFYYTLNNGNAVYSETFNDETTEATVTFRDVFPVTTGYYKVNVYMETYSGLSLPADTIEVQHTATDIAEATVSIQTKWEYTGKAIKPPVTVTYDGATLKQNTDYTVAYSNNKNEGTGTVTITGIGNFTGLTVADFTIAKNSIATCNVKLKTTSYTYSGSAKEPAVTVTTQKGKKLTRNTDYTLEYKNNIKEGIATVTVTGKGLYKGSQKATFTIKPVTPAISKTTAKSSKKIYTKWSIKKKGKITGYEIQLATDKKFKKNLKKRTTTKSSYTMSSLKKNTKYYIRIRAYKKNSDGTKVYSSWSKVKTCKTKK